MGLNFILEYNGDLFHANPSIYKSYETPNPYNKKLTSKEIWDYDYKKRICVKESIDYDVFYVWEKEFLTDEEKYVTIIYNEIMNRYEEKYV